MDNTLTDVVTECIRVASPRGDAAVFGLDTPLVRAGIIDSLAILDITGQLEHRLGLKIPEDLMRPEYFASLRNIVDFVAALPRPA
jgi:acyl carrier protein